MVAFRSVLGSVGRGLSRALFTKRSSKVGFAIILGFVLLIIVGPLFFPPSLLKSNVPDAYAPPSSAHLLGTDYLGADVFAQLIYGAVPSMGVGVLGALGAVLIGLLVGVLAGYYGKLEGALTGLTDLVLIFPPVPLIVLLGTIRTTTNTDLTIILAAVLWPPVARSIRSQVLSLKEMPFVEVAKMSGMRGWEILTKIIIRSVAVIAFAYYVLTVGAAIILVTGLEFLGVGNPNSISWGSMIYWAQQLAYIAGAWWWIIAPGIAISLLTIGFALIGFSFEEVLNPRLRTN